MKKREFHYCGCVSTWAFVEGRWTLEHFAQVCPPDRRWRMGHFGGTRDEELAEEAAEAAAAELGE